MTDQYRVRLTRPYRVGACEVTVGQFRAFVAATGYVSDAERRPDGGVKRRDKELEYGPAYTWRHPDIHLGDDYPVAQVSWDDATRFCVWLSQVDGRKYRLPTEAEWEWAARAGAVTAYSFGDDPGAADAYAWHAGNSDWHPHPVGGKRPNAWGLFDIHGNVCEYCQDGYDDLPTGEGVDPLRRSGAEHRVIRGYSFADPAADARSDARAGYIPHSSLFHFGFRVVCELGE